MSAVPAARAKSPTREAKRGSAASLAQAVADRVTRTVQEKVQRIQEVTRRTKILAVNASIEAARAGDGGKGFSIIAEEVRAVSQEVETLSASLREELLAQINELRAQSAALVEGAAHARLIDLSRVAVELIDRNLYERSCDVRWWATDSALVDCLAAPSTEACAYASQRMGVILNAYTVYLDLWLCDAQGRVIANGRPERAGVVGHNVSREEWFRGALNTGSGDDFVCADIGANRALSGAAVATYATAVREDGRARGRPLGVLGIHFDWTPQAQTIVKGLRLSAEEWAHTRAMLLDRHGRVIAASDEIGMLDEVFPLRHLNQSQGSYEDDNGAMVGFALTPGYETYQGMGWYGCLVTKAR